MSDNPWDNFLEAPYFALVKYGTEVNLGKLRIESKFVYDGKRYILEAIDYEGNKSYAVCLTDRLSVKLSDNETVLVDDRILE